MNRCPTGTAAGMRIMRTAAYVGIAKKLYDESRKPENQRRIKQAVETVRERRARRKA
jgi:hypothetical protein